MEKELPIRDKWEAKVQAKDLTDKVHFLDDINRQLLATQEEINKLTDKLNMHKRDAAYVSAAILQSLPQSVQDAAKDPSPMKVGVDELLRAEQAVLQAAKAKRAADLRGAKNEEFDLLAKTEDAAIDLLVACEKRHD